MEVPMADHVPHSDPPPDDSGLVAPLPCPDLPPDQAPTYMLLKVRQDTGKFRCNWPKASAELGVVATKVQQLGGITIFECVGTLQALERLQSLRYVRSFHRTTPGKVAQRGTGTTGNDAVGAAKRRKRTEHRKLAEVRLKQPIGELMPGGRSGTLHYNTKGRH